MKLSYDKGNMGLQTARDLLREHALGGGMSVKFNWRGEPTLYAGLAPLVYLAKHLGLVDTMLNTNGVALSESFSKKLIHYGLTMCAFSIDSIDPERYEKLRPGAKYGHVMKNLQTFCDNATKLDSDVFIRVQRIRYPDEEMPFEMFADFFERKFPRVNAVAENAYKEKDTSVLWKDIPSEPCTQPWQRLIVAFDGQIGFCCEMNRFEPLGYYPDLTLRDAWKHPGLAKVREMMAKGEIPKPCQKCTVTKVV